MSRGHVTAGALAKLTVSAQTWRTPSSTDLIFYSWEHVLGHEIQILVCTSKSRVSNWELLLNAHQIHCEQGTWVSNRLILMAVVQNCNDHLPEILENL